MSGGDKRRHERARLGRSCWCQSGDVTMYSTVRDISEGGLFVRTSAPLQEGARTRLRLFLGLEGEEIVAEAVVVWRRDGRPRSEPAGMGLCIERIASSDRERIRGYVRDRSGAPAKKM